MTEEAQRKIGNYVVTRTLGAGGMGTVFLAEHPEIGRQVAIKLLKPRLCADENIVRRFVSEARALAKLEHPGIVDVYDFGRTDDGELYYIMEALQGHELGDLVSQRERLAPAEIAPLLEQICSALEAAHSRGIVHRDLKLENVFVLTTESDGGAARAAGIKVLDFGIAKLLQTHDGGGAAQTTTGMIMGTPLYMAPEQAAGMTQMIGPRTDLYSLGVMLFWMLSGRPPFRANATPLVLAAHIADPPPLLAELVPELPSAICELVARCLEKDPADRPASAAEVAQAFRDALQGTGADEVLLLDQRKDQSLPRAVTWSGPSDEADPHGPTEPPPGVTPAQAGREPKSGSARPTTTLSGATGEQHEPAATDAAIASSRRGRWLAIGAAALVVGGVGLWLGTRALRTPPGTEPSAANRTGSAIAGSAGSIEHGKAALAKRAAATAATRHSVRVQVDRPAGVSCRFRLDDGVEQTVFAPCTFSARRGQRVTLVVARAGYAAYRDKWTVKADRRIAVEVRAASARIVIAGAPMRGTGAGIAAGSGGGTGSGAPAKTRTRTAARSSKRARSTRRASSKRRASTKRASKRTRTNPTTPTKKPKPKTGLGDRIVGFDSK